MGGNPFLTMKGISKSFPGVTALDNVDFSCERGEVHGLVGENGAGKSTLIKILSGVIQPDAGEIFIDGAPLRVNNPSRAAQLGISVIHQELNLIGNLSVAQNIFLGREPRRSMGIVDVSEMNKRTREVLDIVGVDVEPNDKVRYLSLQERQHVEVAKALSMDVRILIMDEPTAALNGEEAERLLALMRDLTGRGCGVIFISHRLEEVFAVSNRITVLRDGKLIAAKDRHELDSDTVVRMMTGREQASSRIEGKGAVGRTVLEVNDLSVRGAFQGVSFVLREGEIVGLVGLAGQGQREILRTLFGDRRPSTGQILLHGRPLNMQSPRDAMEAGIAFVPDERKAEGLCLPLDVRQNMALATLEERQTAGFVNRSDEDNMVMKLVRQLRIQLHSPLQEVNSLSGGNQQKVVIAKWLASKPSVLLFCEPTRGIDVGAKEDIYGLIRDLADQGSSVLMVSGDISEVLRVCDRIIIVHDGRVVEEMPAENVDREAIMRAQWGLASKVSTAEADHGS